MKLSFGRTLALESCEEYGIRRGDIAWSSALFGAFAIVEPIPESNVFVPRDIAAAQREHRVARWWSWPWTRLDDA
jgi:hypothetical protein